MTSLQINPGAAGTPILYLPGISVQSLVAPPILLPQQQQQQQLAPIAQLQQLVGLNTTAYTTNVPNQPQGLLTQTPLNSSLLPLGANIPNTAAVVLRGNNQLTTAPTNAVYQAQQPRTTQRQSIVLYLERDANVLSPYQCLVRQ